MVQQLRLDPMVYYYLDKTRKEPKMVADLPGWENPRPRKKENNMANMDDRMKDQGKLGGSPFNTDPETDKPPILNSATTNNSFTSTGTINAPVTGTNIDPYLAIVATILSGLTSVVVAKGWVDATSWITISGSLLSIIAMLYMAYRTRTEGKISSLASTLNVPKSALKRHIMAAYRNHN